MKMERTKQCAHVPLLTAESRAPKVSISVHIWCEHNYFGSKFKLNSLILLGNGLQSCVQICRGRATTLRARTMEPVLMTGTKMENLSARVRTPLSDQRVK